MTKNEKIITFYNKSKDELYKSKHVVLGDYLLLYLVCLNITLSKINFCPSKTPFLLLINLSFHTRSRKTTQTAALFDGSLSEF
jgi:hypothetical protein